MSKSSETIKARDPDFYKRIGAMGGKKKGVKKGFAAMDKEQLKQVASKGGKATWAHFGHKSEGMEYELLEEGS